MATASATSTSTTLVAFHRSHGKLATVTARPPAGALRRDRARRRPGRAVLREAADRASAGSTAASSSSSPAVLDYIDGDDSLARAGRARAAGRRRRAAGVPAPRLLPADGHAAREAAARGAVAERASRRGCCPTMTPRAARLVRGQAGLRHRPHRVQGRVAVARGSTGRRRRSSAMRWRRRRQAAACSRQRGRRRPASTR